MTTSMNSFHAQIKNWWIPALIGIALIATSVLIVNKPLEAYLGLSLAFAVLVFASGVLNTVFSIANRKVMDGWGWYLVLGLIELFVGGSMLMFPPLSAEVLLLYMGFWFAFRGTMSMTYAWMLKQVGIKGWGWLMFWGLLTLVFSFLMVMNPLFGLIGILVLTALSFLFLGIFSLMLGLELRKINRLLA
ncbi:MAG TPA: HdeD family acid-resistance protein [Phaeodactylibacter sp.]|nr:HdeD family acid-resistance protein [Phaeodactylibacter sp.]